VEDALGSGIDWDLFYQFIPYESAMSIIYEGGHDSEFLPTETRDDCFCMTERELTILDAPGGILVDQTHYAPILSSGCWICSQLRVKVLGSETSWRPFTIVSMEATGASECSEEKLYRVWDYPGEELIYAANTPPSNLSNCKLLTVSGDHNFGTNEIIWSRDD
jgi:hypothetical protein